MQESGACFVCNVNFRLKFYHFTECIGNPSEKKKFAEGKNCSHFLIPIMKEKKNETFARIYLKLTFSFSVQFSTFFYLSNKTMKIMVTVDVIKMAMSCR